MKEKQTFHVNGYLALIVLIALMIGGGYLFYDGIVRNAVLGVSHQCRVVDHRYLVH